ncbi:hypothetical protein, partial [Azospirillum sp. B4]|uniref:hypothetical protein n=1 Tax=Azospirillum sp. B4 TaxID=95605 RepID=UPI0005C88092
MTAIAAALLPETSAPGPWGADTAVPAATTTAPVVDRRPPVTVDDSFGRHRPGGLPALLLALGASLPASRWGKAAGGVLGPVVRTLVPWLYGSVIDVSADGVRRRLHVRDHADDRRFLALPRQAASQARARIAAGLPADGVFVDVGAGTGLHTLAAARRMGAG